MSSGSGADDIEIDVLSVPGPAKAGVRPGDMLAGKYRIDKPLGEGGMGVVYAARHVALDRGVAIKLLLPHAVEDRVLVARFVREARAAAKLQSEHVVRVIDVGVTESQVPYMVMELLDGADLASIARSHGQLPIREAVDYVLQALEALAEAHALGIVHRDLKPSNLFVTRSATGAPVVKVLDFGIAKAEPSGPHSATAHAVLTTTETVMGSPAYMSPEQVRSTRNVDARADLWSIGVVLYELLAGERPFSGASTGDILLAVLEDTPPPLRRFRPDVPPELESVVMRCLARDPDQRVASAAELARDLAPWGSPRARPLAAPAAAVSTRTDLGAPSSSGRTALDAVVPTIKLGSVPAPPPRRGSRGDTTSGALAPPMAHPSKAIAVVAIAGVLAAAIGWWVVRSLATPTVATAPVAAAVAPSSTAPTAAATPAPPPVALPVAPSTAAPTPTALAPPPATARPAAPPATPTVTRPAAAPPRQAAPPAPPPAPAATAAPPPPKPRAVDMLEQRE